MDVSGIIISKKSANRPKDKIMLPYLYDFEKNRKKEVRLADIDNFYRVPLGFKIADVQTLLRWNKGMKESVSERLERL